jgi:tetratricopeptide (TPR) repeat protein/serine/threonine protein kinase
MPVAPDRLKAVFDLAAEAPEPAARAAVLDRECAGDPALRERVEALLQAHDAVGSFLAHPPAAGPDATVGHEPEDGPTADRPAAGESPGAVIGPYKLLDRIGEGGFGVVYMAEQTHPVRRKVALKVLKPGMDTKQVVARFEAERQALAILDHPNIAPVFDGGTTPAGRPYFVMELVKGVPITDFCDHNHLSPRQRLELFLAVCAAVQHAHQKGIVHRDLKPSNVLVARHDTTPVVKVIDFGVAKALGQELTDKTLFTGLAQMVGTPLYMSPEQAGMSDLDVDTRSDVYSLGVLLYELLTGTTPFPKERFKRAAYDEIRRIIREEEPPKPSTRLSESKDELPSVAASRQTEPARLTKLVRGELDWIVMRALEKDRNRRYETANGFARDVQRYLADEPVEACPPSAGYRLRKFARRNRSGLAVAALVLSFLVVLGIGAGWVVRDRSAREAEATRQQGERQAKVAGQVERFFADVDRLEQEQKWPEALAAARRAGAAVAGGEADPATAEQVHQRLRDLEFIDRLERIRMAAATTSEGTFNYADTDRDYARAFRAYGVDVDELPVETSIDRFNARAVVAVALAAALDHWSIGRHRVSEEDDTGWQRLVAVARGIDPEPLRDRVRASRGRPGANVRDELRRLAESIDVRAHHPATLVILAGSLRAAQHPDAALRILREARYLHPEDFWLNFELGHALDLQEDREGAIRFYTAAVAIRPDSAVAHNNLGIVLYTQKKLVEAVDTFHKAIEIDPQYAFAYTHLGHARLAQKKLPEALDAYHRALEIDPKLVNAYLGRGCVLTAQRKLPEAIDAINTAIALDPKNASAHYTLGDTLHEQGNLEGAVASYRRAIAHNPTYAPAHCNLGYALRDQQKLPEALDAFHEAIKHDPKLVNAHAGLGDVFHGKMNLPAAIDAYRKAIELDPKYAGAYIGLGRVLRAQKNVPAALDAFHKAIELDPKQHLAHNALGVLFFTEMKDFGKAEAAFRKAIELAPKNAEAYGNLGNALIRQKQWDEGFAAYRKAIELDPTDAKVHGNFGRALFDQGNLDEAVAEYRKAIELDPKSAAGHNNLGHVLYRKNQLDDAFVEFRKAVELDPKSAEFRSHLVTAHMKLGTTLRLQGKLDEAVAEFRRANKLIPNRVVAHFELGRILRSKGQYDEALAVYHEAVELDPKNDLSYNALGTALYEQKKFDESIAWHKKAIELQPKNAGAHYHLGNSLQAKGELDGAERAYREAVRLDGDHYGAAIEALALLHLSRDNVMDALATAGRAVDLAPQSARAWQVLGWARYRAGDWTACIEALEKSCSFQDDPKGGDASQWFLLAMAHWQLGRKQKAREWYDRAVGWMDKNNPRDEELRRFRAGVAELLELKEKK